MNRYNFIICSIFVSCLFIFIPQHLFAQTAPSNCVVTKVGTPLISPTLPANCAGGSSSDVIKAGEDVKAAMDSCEQGFTFDVAGVDTCLKNYLTNVGYSPERVGAYLARRKTAMVYHVNADGRQGYCNECLGFVGTVLTLVTGDTNALLGFGAAGNVTKLQSFKAGDTTYVKIGSGIQADIQPGDIAIAGNDSDPGHITFVKEVQGNIAFIALESNANYDCKLYDTRKVQKTPYSYYRKQ